MIDINTALQNILKAIYGKDVRQSIHDAIYQINQNANEAIDLAQIKFGTDITDPTSPVGYYIEGTVYFNVETGIIWKLSGGSWSQLGTMKTINTIEKTSTSGLVDTYTISYNDGTTKNYTVTNGEKGTSVVNITKVSTTGNVDHYDVNLSDGTRTPNGFDVANGISITDISLESTVGNVKNYKVNLSNGSKTPTGFSIADGVSSYVYIRYSANFDGSGMVAVPSDQTVYIGICVTTQSTAPTDPAVYSWVRFIGKSGTGSGDMLASDYATLYAKTVDRAAALYDGNKEISADQLMDKSTYADADLTETVKKATTLVDKVNSKEADTEVLAKFSESAEGKLLYDNKSIEPDIDNETIVRNEAGEMTLGEGVTTKLQAIDESDYLNDSKTYKTGDLFIYANSVYKVQNANTGVTGSVIKQNFSNYAIATTIGEEVNSLNQKLTNPVKIPITVASGVTLQYNESYCIGKLCIINLRVSLSSAKSDGDSIATIDSKYAPNVNGSYIACSSSGRYGLNLNFTTIRAGSAMTAGTAIISTAYIKE